MSGDADALVHLRTADMAALERVLEELRGEWLVERSRSSIVLSNVMSAVDT